MDSLAPSKTRVGSSGDRLLAVLGLFTVEQPEWTVEEVAVRLGVSATTSYRYFKALTRAGLISPVAGAGYRLGPAIVEMDRLIQLCDPMLIAARPVMDGLLDRMPPGAVVLLCRLFHDRVICVHQVRGPAARQPVSYERGRPMPLFRGATSKIILAHLPPRGLRALFAANAPAIAEAGLGSDRESFRAALAALRRAGVAVTAGDIDPGQLGVAAPVFDVTGAILGSLSAVLPERTLDAPGLEDLKTALVRGAWAIEGALANRFTRERPARLRVGR